MYAPVYRVELVRERRLEVPSRNLRSPEAAAEILHSYYESMDREALVVLGLTTKMVLIGLQTASVGTLDCSLVHPREVFKPALLMNASSVIVAHNHPSGDPEPSPEDCAVTRRLISAGAALGIELCDHLVIGEGSFVSLRQRGVWEQAVMERAVWQREAEANRSGAEAGAGMAAEGRAGGSAGRLPRPFCRELPMRFLSLRDEAFSHVAANGTLRAWNVTRGNEIASGGHELMLFPLAYHGVTPEKVQGLYDGIDAERAMEADLARPLLFIPFFGEMLLIDGWHRLYKAACLGVEELPMYLLTQEEADSICFLVG